MCVSLQDFTKRRLECNSTKMYLVCLVLVVSLLFACKRRRTTAFGRRDATRYQCEAQAADRALILAGRLLWPVPRCILSAGHTHAGRDTEEDEQVVSCGEWTAAGPPSGDLCSICGSARNCMQVTRGLGGVGGRPPSTAVLPRSVCTGRYHLLLAHACPERCC